MTTVLTVKFNPELNLVTQTIQITKVHSQHKWPAEEVLLMTSLVLIFTIFLQKKSFFICQDYNVT